MANVIIVDQNDKPIGLRERELITYDEIYRVSSLWLTNSQGQTLLAQRTLSKKNDPGKWGPAVAGTVEEGESYESNIYKEAKEEIGLEGYKFTPTTKRYFDDGKYRFFCQIFAVQIDKLLEEFTIQESEVDQLKWIDTKALFQDIELNSKQYTSGMAYWRELGLQ